MGVNGHTKRNVRQLFCFVSTFLLICLVGLLASTVTLAVLYRNESNKKPPQCAESASLPEWPLPSTTQLGVYTRATVATDNTFCSEIGRDTIRKGGSAVDAAIAALFCIGVTDPHSTSISGGFFMTIYNATSKSCTAIDAREVAPGLATEEMYKGNPNGSRYGWNAVAVPGQLHGLATAYRTHGSGRIEWRDMIMPTVALLKTGVPCSEDLAHALRARRDIVMASKTMKAFINPETGDVFKHGEIIKTRAVLADFLEKLAAAADPIKFFYDSDEITQQLVDEFTANGGLLSRDDFRNYKSKVHDTADMMVTRLSNGRTACGPPPPSSSAVAMGILSVMDGYEHNTTTFDGIVEFYHRYIESSKFAFASRSLLADPDFWPNATEVARNLTTTAWAEWIRSRITEKSHPDAYYGGEFAQLDDHGTTHVAVLDEEGNAVSVTSTMNLYLGAIVSSESTGIVWNDEMDDFGTPGFSNDFGFPPSPANFIRPGKRPLSSMTPLVVFGDDGSVYVTGAAGGSTIISATTQNALHSLWAGVDLKTSMDRPRVHNQLQPNNTYFEPGFPKAYIESLAARGHLMTNENATMAEATHAIRRADGKVFANSDWRKGVESNPAGF